MVSAVVWVSTISVSIGVGRISVTGISVMVSVSVWVVSGVCIPGLWIGFSFGLSFSFSLLDNVNCSTAVGVVGIWFYDGSMSICNGSVIVSISSSIWISSIVVWMSVDYWFDGFLSFCYWFFGCLFSGLDYCWVGIGVVIWVPVSVGVWMMITSVCVVIKVWISFGFRLGCGCSK